MWRYEVAYYDERGWYRWKGFGHVDKFDRFLRKLQKEGLKIVGITNMDGPEALARYEAEFLTKNA